MGVPWKSATQGEVTEEEDDGGDEEDEEEACPPPREVVGEYGREEKTVYGEEGVKS